MYIPGGNLHACMRLFDWDGVFGDCCGMGMGMHMVYGLVAGDSSFSAGVVY